jgi:NitT/TauT family transport system substrate-binding protein
MKAPVKFALIFGIMGALFFGFLKFKDQILPKAKQPGSILTEETRGPVGITPTNNMQPGNIPILRVLVCTWPGWGGPVYFNNGFEPNKESRFYKDYGFMVQFIKSDELTNSRNAWLGGSADLMWTTVDCFASQLPSIQSFKPRLLYQVDWSRGGDSLVVNFGIDNVADLKGKKVSCAMQSPSTTLLITTLQSGNMELSDIQLIECADAIASASMFKSGQVDAAVVWSPDDLGCIQSVKGSKILINTKTNANFIIADAFYAPEHLIQSNPQMLTDFVEGALIGAAEINTDVAAKKKAAGLLAYGLGLTSKEMEDCMDNARFCTLGDNLNFFGLNTSYTGVKGEDLYNQMGRIYAALDMAPKVLPPWRDITCLTIMQKLQTSPKLTGIMHEAEGAVHFKPATVKEATASAISSKTLSVTFATGSSSLDANAQIIIDIGFSDIAKQFGAARIRVVGRTDNVGSRESNVELSKRRANKVVQYLVNTYGFDKNRFIIEGKGPDDPLADNATEQGRAKNRCTEFQLLGN